MKIFITTPGGLNCQHIPQRDHPEHRNYLLQLILRAGQLHTIVGPCLIQHMPFTCSGRFSQGPSTS